jgi:hypothetical protein
MHSIDLSGDGSDEDSTKKSKKTCDNQGRNMNKNAMAPICVELFMLLVDVLSTKYC